MASAAACSSSLGFFSLTVGEATHRVFCGCRSTLELNPSPDALLDSVWLAVDPLYSKETEDAGSDVWIVLIGVGAGAVLSAFVPPVTHWLTKKRRRRTLALLVCPALDRFVADCQAAIDDEGERPRGNLLPSVPMPTGPEFPTEVDWTAIDPKLANRILSLRVATTRIDHELRYVVEELHDPPDNEQWFSYRRTQCLKLLRVASDLSLAAPPGGKAVSVLVGGREQQSPLWLIAGFNDCVHEGL